MKHIRIKAEETCSFCKGSGRVRGGQVEYGELVACQPCKGTGWLATTLEVSALANRLKSV